MAMVTMKQMLVEARQKQYALGAFEFWSVDSARAVIAEARRRGLPAILQTGPAECDFVGYRNIGMIGKMMEENTDLPFALHLDHATTVEEIKKALDVGFTSVMIDASSKAYTENFDVTCQVVELAKTYGATVESELGHVAGAESNITCVSEEEATQTDPAQAKQFAEGTGIDFLAVAIGTVHGEYRFKPQLNIERLKEIASLVSLPMVLHGGSDTPHEKITEAVHNGIAKVNICTDFLKAMGQQYIATQQQTGFRYSIVGLYTPAYEAGCKLVGEKMDLFSQKRVMEAWLVLRGLRTLDVRLERHFKTAMQVTEYLENHPKISKVYYPFAKSFKQSDLANAQQKGANGLLSFEIGGTTEQAKTVVNSLRMFKIGVSWGGFESLVCMPYLRMNEELQQRHGASNRLTRKLRRC